MHFSHIHLNYPLSPQSFCELKSLTMLSVHPATSPVTYKTKDALGILSDSTFCFSIIVRKGVAIFSMSIN